jgi:hypothetical protein
LIFIRISFFVIIHKPIYLEQYFIIFLTYIYQLPA